ncbi:hypothetical protein HPP92_015318 [Vanilla planifolia]|uniref:Uncharacterized protein n=1 Tax=Vanilla planifolia TaxID=51239 RepID=A0A835QM34_VANPL|nr:hypothetical protein HPP92_015318 [Vanilla planifolia]
MEQGKQRKETEAYSNLGSPTDSGFLLWHTAELQFQKEREKIRCLHLYPKPCLKEKEGHWMRKNGAGEVFVFR